MYSRVKLLSLVLPALLILVAACSSSNNKSNSNSNNSGSSNSNTSSQASSGKKLSACEYAGQVLKAFSAFGAATSSSPTDANAAKTAINTILDAAKQGINSLQSITPPDDFKQFHADFMKTMQDVVNQLQNAQKSLDSGDPNKALTALDSVGSSFLDQVDKLQKKYPSQTKALDACPTPAS